MGIGRLAPAPVSWLSACLGGARRAARQRAPLRATSRAPELDGTYHVEIDGQRTLRDGAPSPDQSTTLQWAFRSDCGSSACIAVAVPVNDKTPPKTGEPSIWDYVDGAWVRTVTGRLDCGGTLAPTLETWSLRPGDVGTLTGTRYMAFFGGGAPRSSSSSSPSTAPATSVRRSQSPTRRPSRR